MWDPSCVRFRARNAGPCGWNGFRDSRAWLRRQPGILVFVRSSVCVCVFQKYGVDKMAL